MAKDLDLPFQVFQGDHEQQSKRDEETEEIGKIEIEEEAETTTIVFRGSIGRFEIVATAFLILALTLSTLNVVLGRGPSQTYSIVAIIVHLGILLISLEALLPREIMVVISRDGITMRRDSTLRSITTSIPMEEIENVYAKVDGVSTGALFIVGRHRQLRIGRWMSPQECHHLKKIVDRRLALLRKEEPSRS